MKKNLYILLKVVLIPVAYAVLLRLFFGVNTWKDLFSVMSITFLFCLPTICGALAIYFSSDDKVENRWYRLLVPWVPIFVFFGATLLFDLEGWGCWIMVLPLFLLAASVGGHIGAHFKRKKNDKTYMSLLMLTPFFLAPLEHLVGNIPGTYKAYTFIDINASPAKIWSNVTRVKSIDPVYDKGWLTRFLQFPRPVKAELNYAGVGGYREAVFTNGLVFHETVTEYVHEQKMAFTIKANPYEIPSATMDEHIVIGGEFFDVLNGTYELEKLNATTCRLHLYSHFKLNTTFNFYAAIWASWIMKDIQNNILQVEKYRAENN